MTTPKLRMKASVQSVTRSADSNGDITAENVSLTAVYGPSGSVNNQWSKWTPSITFTFTVTNPSAFGKVLPGQFYFIDLIETTKDAMDVE